MNYSVPRIQSLQITGNPWAPVRIRSGASSLDPQIEAFTPGAFMGGIGDPVTVWVDLIYGDDNDANNYATGTNQMQLTAIHPFKTFRAAWVAAVTLANNNPSVYYVIRLKNTANGYLFPVGSPPITVVPRYPNVTVKGDGIDVTVFDQASDYLTFYLDATGIQAPCFLQFEDMTLGWLYLRCSNPATGSPGLTISQPVYLRGNRSTGIRHDIGIFGGNATASADVSDSSTASNGPTGGNTTNVSVDGFIAVNTGQALLNIVGGNGGNGGNAHVFYGGEYNDQESYGTAGNGGSPGIVDKVIVSNMLSRPFINIDTPTYASPGGWYMVFQQGAVGTGGVDVGGTQDGNKNTSDGLDIGATTIDQKVQIINSDVLDLQSYPPASPADGRAKVKMHNCRIGFHNNPSSRTLCCYELTTTGGLMHPSVNMQIGSTSNTTSTPVDDLFVA